MIFGEQIDFNEFSFCDRIVICLYGNFANHWFAKKDYNGCAIKMDALSNVVEKENQRIREFNNQSAK